jgi:putative membrane protein
MTSEISPPPPDPRVVLAAERTMLAWMRTGLALMGFGFVVARFGMFLHEIAAARGATIPPGRPLSMWLGLGLIALGVVVLAGAGWRYHRYVTGLERDCELPPPGSLFGVVVAGLLVGVGVVLAIFLMTMD